MTKKFYEFKEGDRASFGGLKGTCFIKEDHKYPVRLKYDLSDSSDEFTLNGKFLSTHKKPLLKRLVKKKRKNGPLPESDLAAHAIKTFIANQPYDEKILFDAKRYLLGKKEEPKNVRYKCVYKHYDGDEVETALLYKTREEAKAGFNKKNPVRLSDPPKQHKLLGTIKVEIDES